MKNDLDHPLPPATPPSYDFWWCNLANLGGTDLISPPIRVDYENFAIFYWNRVLPCDWMVGIGWMWPLGHSWDVHGQVQAAINSLPQRINYSRTINSPGATIWPPFWRENSCDYSNVKTGSWSWWLLDSGFILMQLHGRQKVSGRAVVGDKPLCDCNTWDYIKNWDFIACLSSIHRQIFLQMEPTCKF